MNVGGSYYVSFQNDAILVETEQSLASGNYSITLFERNKLRGYSWADEIYKDHPDLEKMPWIKYFKWGGILSAKSSPLTIETVIKIVSDLEKLNKLKAFS